METDQALKILRMKTGAFVLRQAAGSYWLLDIRQPGYPYRPPLKLNESGAEIWRMLCEGKTEEEMASRLSADEAQAEAIREDLHAFLGEMLRAL